MAENVTRRLQEFYEEIRKNLDSTVQFWLSHSIDHQHGGYFSCLDVDGTVYDTTKYCWPLCRQVWMLARLYQEVERFHTPHILSVAKHGAEFILQHVQNEATGRCYLSLTREGRPVKLQRTIFSEAFFVMAMSEMYRVTAEQRYKDPATATMKKIILWVRTDNSELGLSVASPTQTSSLAIPMILLMLVSQMETVNLGQARELSELSDWCVTEISKHAVSRPDGLAVLENVGPDGSELPGCSGRLLNPGHAIEAGWFLLERAIKLGHNDLKTLALRVISSSFTRGWDVKFGGLFSFLDVDGRPPLQLEWDMKMWWPLNEALIAFLMAYRETRQLDHLTKFATVFDYSMKRLVDREHGEWFGYLSREGDVKIKAKGGQWKGFFHVPRALMMCEKILHEILQDGDSFDTRHPTGK